MREKLMFQNAPHVRQSESVLTIMTDVVIALVPLYIMSFFYYGVRALVLGLCGVASCLVFSAVGSLVSKERPNIRDLTSAITGLIIPLLMPADVPYYVVLAACAVAILVVKLPFGGTGYNLFNPAAVGFASVALCWPELVYRYPAVLRTLSVFGENAEKAATSPAHSLAIGAVPEYDVLDLLLGSAPGPMGATNILVIVACGVFLIVRKAVNWRTPVFFLLTYGVCAALFPRIGGSAFDALCYELFSGMIVFGAFFMLSEPVTSPKRDFGKLLYSVVAGIVVFLFGYFGGFEDGFVYALIVLNVFTPVFDTICENTLHLYRNRDRLVESIESDIKNAAVKKPAAPVVRKHKKAEKAEKLPAEAIGVIPAAEEAAEPVEVTVFAEEIPAEDAKAPADEFTEAAMAAVEATESPAEAFVGAVAKSAEADAPDFEEIVINETASAEAPAEAEKIIIEEAPEKQAENEEEKEAARK